MASLYDRIAKQVASANLPKVDVDFRLPPGMNPAIEGALSGSPLLGGVDWKRAREIYDQSAKTEFAKKNLWLLQITDVSPLNLANSTFDSVRDIVSGGLNGFNVDSLGSLASMAAGFSRYSRGLDFNLFATDVSYPLAQVDTDPQKVGGAVFSTINGTSLTELRITTLDDKRGTLKKWAKLKAALVVLPNGAIGLPITYLLKVRVMHAFIADDIQNAENAYQDEMVMYVTGVETELSRRDDNLQELQITLTQFDTFTNLI